jgi:hypothetical protein
MGLETPEQGGRVVLTRADVGNEVVTYEIALHTPTAQWTALARIGVGDGRIELGALEGEGGPPPWLLEMARAFLRSVWTGRQREANPVWPRRVRRWRAPKPSRPAR